LHTIWRDEHEGLPHPRCRNVEGAAEYPTEAWLLDACSPKTSAGLVKNSTGIWLSKRKNLANRFFLAGGLTPENVAAAVRQVQPFAWMFPGGVESAPGKKDPQKVREFIANVRQAEQK